jgi:imidazole glycerol-phosphate synthase subunit HisH
VSAARGSPARIAVLDYGMGNLRSVEKALERVGARADVTDDRERVRAADGVVLPGVGAFPKAMEAVHARGLDALVRERAVRGVPILGICLGAQLLFEASAEHGGADGIGLLEGTVERIPADGLKLPQIGWNPVSWRRPSRLAEQVPDPCPFYHVHSFAPVPRRDADVLGIAIYGSGFVSAVERHPVYGVQFHPEKSGAHGLRVLGGFAAICSSRPAAARTA